ncbi:MAG: hypothetical protein ACFHU9_14985 [Fluviicola sp.]
MHGKKNIFSTPCQESWEDMDGDERKRLCAVCNQTVQDVSNLSIESLEKNITNTDKCVRMSSDQRDYFKFFQSAAKVAGLSTALSIMPLHSTFAQTENQREYCIVTGKVKSNFISNRTIFVIVNGTKHEAMSNSEGTFRLMVPKGENIEYSNVKKLRNKTFEKDSDDIKKVRLPKMSTFIGTPSF